MIPSSNQHIITSLRDRLLQKQREDLTSNSQMEPISQTIYNSVGFQNVIESDDFRDDIRRVQDIMKTFNTDKGRKGFELGDKVIINPETYLATISSVISESSGQKYGLTLADGSKLKCLYPENELIARRYDESRVDEIIKVLVEVQELNLKLASRHASDQKNIEDLVSVYDVLEISRDKLKESLQKIELEFKEFQDNQDEKLEDLSLRLTKQLYDEKKEEIRQLNAKVKYAEKTVREYKKNDSENTKSRSVLNDRVSILERQLSSQLERERVAIAEKHTILEDVERREKSSIAERMELLDFFNEQLSFIQNAESENEFSIDQLFTRLIKMMRRTKWSDNSHEIIWRIPKYQNLLRYLCESCDRTSHNTILMLHDGGKIDLIDFLN